MLTDLKAEERENLVDELKAEGRHVAAQQVAATIHLTTDQLRELLATFAEFLRPKAAPKTRVEWVDVLVEAAVAKTTNTQL